MSLESQIIDIAKNAKNAFGVISLASTEQKNDALLAMAGQIRKNTKSILAANKKDVVDATANKRAGSFLDRLVLDDERIEAMSVALEDIAKLPDPVGRVLETIERPNGLSIQRVSVPIGVIGIIYESRPNVTADAGSLCIKSGNVAILRGGSESYQTSSLIVEALQDGLEIAGLPRDAISYLPSQEREAVGHMLRCNDYIDLIIPRGGKGLIKRIMADSNIPTLQHLDGNNHIFVHADADISKAVSVVVNAKMRRTGVCGAAETIVVDAAIAGAFLPALLDEIGECELRGEADAQAIDARIMPANDEDWGTEYLDAILAVKIVDGVSEVIEFIQQYSSGHTDAIITENTSVAGDFLRAIDSAIVMHNASTQFADGGEFGMGAEIGISTGRLHARGPVGLEQLNIFKYIVYGDGQIRG